MPAVQRSPYPEITPEGRRALESRVGTDELDILHARRRALLPQYAPLKALYAHGGTWDSRRKSMVEALKVKARMHLIETTGKATDAAVEAAAYSDPAYVRFLDEGERGMIDYVTLNVEWMELEERIYSRSLEISAFSAEARLAR